MSLFLTKNKSFFVCFLLLISPTSLGFSAENASAQIMTDSTLPNNTEVLDNNNFIEIVGGTTAGNNLFHSFEQFSLEQGNTAFFNNAETISNIFSRVTGNSISNIDGLIRANGTADLFLINPNGIIFGENATLDIGGSFIGSTADSIIFQDNSQFSAVNPVAPTLLTVNIPIGLQFGSNPGDITVRGNGHNTFFDFDTFSVNRLDRNRGLEVASTKTIALLGKNIFLEGGNITASMGNIELGAIGQIETVGIIESELNLSTNLKELDNEINGGEIQFSSAASIDVSGETSGNIQLLGKTVNILNGSTILAETNGDVSGGLTHIKAEEVNIIGIDPDFLLPSSIWSYVYFGGTGDGGNIVIDAAQLNVENGGRVVSTTFGLGNGGDLTVRAKDIRVIGQSEERLSPSALATTADIGETGKAGNLSIETDTLLLEDRAQIVSSTFGNGDAGNLTIETDTLIVKDLAEVQSNSVGSGIGGNLIIEADRVEITDRGGVFSSANRNGNGGSITLTAKSLSLTSAGQIAGGTLSSGNGGNIQINAKDLTLSGAEDTAVSGIFANAFRRDGNGGDISIKSDRLTITDGASISASNFQSRNVFDPGTGETGTITIETNYLELDNNNSDVPSRITTASNELAGGDITLNVSQDISIKGNSKITAETRGIGNGGSITIDANNLELLDEGGITVNSFVTGDAGNINVVTGDRINLNQGTITATSDQSGGGEITLDTNFLNLQNQSEISTSVLDGSGVGGNININSNILLGRDSSQIIANADEGTGGNISINTEIFLFSFDSEVDASSRLGLDGNIDINSLDTNQQISVVKLPENLFDSTALVAAFCSVETIDSLITTGKGGLAENPRQNIRSESVWEDLRNFASSSVATRSQVIIEAKAWTINQNGNIELLSQIPSNSIQNSEAIFNTCQH